MLAACWAAASAACLVVTGCSHAGSAGTDQTTPRVTALGNPDDVEVSVRPLIATYNPASQAPPVPPSQDWRQVPSPALPRDAQVYTITATGPADAWAAGTSGLNDGQALLVHWNGTSWTRPALPASTLGLSEFTSLASAGPRNVWVSGVGTTGNWPSPHIYHFGGARWDEVRLPSDVTGVEGISMTPAGNLWTLIATRAYPGEALIRWNGRGWTRFPAPSPAGGIPAIAAVADDDIWVTGRVSQIYHWNGEHWTPAASPAPSSGEGMRALIAPAHDDVWAAHGFNVGPATAILLHWDGRTWQTVPVPHTGSCPATGISPDGAGGIWVIPCQSNWLGAQYLHWQADRWTDVYASPPGPHSAETAQAIALVPGTQQLWSADSGPDGETLNLYTPR